jgi:hypothetical protein
MGGCRIEFKQIDDRADRAFCALTNRWHAGAVDDGGGLSVAWLWVSPRWLLAPLLCPYGPLTATQESSTAATASIKVTAWVTVVPFESGMQRSHLSKDPLSSHLLLPGQR